MQITADLSGRVAIVTGASSGLGARFASVLASAGADVVATARRSERLEQLAAESPRVRPLACDVADPDGPRRLVAAALGWFGRVDICVNNAGVSSGGDDRQATLDGFRSVLRVGVALGSAVVRTDAWHHRSDAITSLAAGIGISVALIGGKDYAMADDVAAIVAAGIIAWNGWRLLRPALDELMDTSPDPAVAGKVSAVAATIPGVVCVEKCIARKMGYHFFVDMHVEVDPQMSVQRGHQIAHEVKDKVRAQVPEVYDVLVHIEPSRGAKK